MKYFSSIFASMPIVGLCFLPQQETLLNVVLLRIFEVKQPSMSALDQTKHSGTFAYLLDFYH